ncbi:MAG: dual specificity protein phosphatase family protein [Candidatus Heimdallarchaeota archaeon]|nr:dual specificity protein phosphatase family protein [Candidatus Heimdallarchaeota archaeon]
MKNFYWLIEGQIAGSPYPKTDSDFEFLKSKGIKTIINLTKESLGYISQTSAQTFSLFNIQIEDFSIPTIDQISAIWDIVQDQQTKLNPIVSHCQGGCGRTGMVLVILLGLLDLETNPEAALKRVRNLRSCSVETEGQERFIRKIFSEKSQIFS